jgi:NAD(P)-dependent dehydrogenase (short-subunit alcohol dehydrogenase family)
MEKDLAGKVFLITGGTEGIGKAASLDIAARGATMSLIGRNAEKTERVATELRAAGAERVDVIIADMSKIAEMRAAAAKFKASADRLDVLINNAGAVFLTKQLSADGLEMTFALNHLAYFVLTNEVLGLLKKTPGSRVVSTSSGAHAGGRIDFDDIAKCPSGRTGFNAYCDSKLANVLFTRELAKRLEGTKTTANCYHPGFVETGFGKNNTGFLAGAIAFTASLFARSPEKGAETLVWLATSPDAASTTGEYFMDKKVKKTKAIAYDKALATKLWKFTEELTAAPN